MGHYAKKSLAKLLTICILCAAWSVLAAQNLDARLAVVDSLVGADNIDAATEQIEALEVEYLKPSNLQDRLQLLRYAGAFFNDNFESPNHALRRYAEAIDLGRRLDPGNTSLPTRFDDIFQYGNVLYHSGRHKELIVWVEEQMPEISRLFGNESIEVARMYNFSALAYNSWGQYEKSGEYNDYAISIAAAMGNAAMEAHFLDSKAFMMEEQGRGAEAIAVRRQSLDIMERDPNAFGKSLGDNYNKMAEALNVENRADEAIEYLKKAADIYPKFYKNTNDVYYYLWLAYGKAHRIQGDFVQMETAYKKALQVRPKGRIARRGLALCLANKGQFTEAYALMDTLFSLFGYTPGMRWEAHEDPFVFSEYLAAKGNIYALEFDRTGNLDLLEKAIALFDEVASLMRQNINIYYQETSKQFTYAEAVKYHKRAIELRLLHYEKTKDERDLSAAFHLSETNKSLLLYQSLQQNKRLSECGLPPELAQQKDSLDRAIATSEKAIFENGISVERQKLLLDQHHAYDKTMAEIDRYCKNFSREAFQYPNDILNAAQALCDDSTTVVSFSSDEKAITMFIVNKNDVAVRKIPFDDTQKTWIKTYVLTASDTRENAGAQRNAIAFAEAATGLYNCFFRPVEASLRPRLVLIPDGQLVYFPFEALLTETPQNPDRFSTHAYWLEKHSITYSYSVGLWREMSQAASLQTPTENMLAVAPFWDKNGAISSRYGQNDFQPLPFSNEEAQKTAEIMHGKVLVGSEATIAAVVGQMGKFKVLHFATHAKSNSAKGKYSYLAFYPENETKASILYARDIYETALSADLVTLSACETGLGEFQSGEGLISLARAFAHSGARSLVTTLWSVHDERTKDIMILFYENFSKGLSKDIALQQAKLQYLRQTKGAFGHPYYWAGFELIGKRT